MRAYTDAAQQVIAATPTRVRVDSHRLVVRIPYDRFDPCRETIVRAGGSVVIVDEAFGEDARLTLEGAADELAAVRRRLLTLTAGRVRIEIGDDI